MGKVTICAFTILMSISALHSANAQKFKEHNIGSNNVGNNIGGKNIGGDNIGGCMPGYVCSNPGPSTRDQIIGGVIGGIISGIVNNNRNQRQNQQQIGQPIGQNNVQPKVSSGGQFSNAHYSHCLNKYKSYQIATNTYTTFGGQTRQCMSPYN